MPGAEMSKRGSEFYRDLQNTGDVKCNKAGNKNWKIRRSVKAKTKLNQFLKEVSTINVTKNSSWTMGVCRWFFKIKFSIHQLPYIAGAGLGLNLEGSGSIFL